MLGEHRVLHLDEKQFIESMFLSRYLIERKQVIVVWFLWDKVCAYLSLNINLIVSN